MFCHNIYRAKFSANFGALQSCVQLAGVESDFPTVGARELSPNICLGARHGGHSLFRIFLHHAKAIRIHLL
jgi:hypothetical protein